MLIRTIVPYPFYVRNTGASEAMTVSSISGKWLRRSDTGQILIILLFLLIIIIILSLFYHFRNFRDYHSPPVWRKYKNYVNAKWTSGCHLRDYRPYFRKKIPGNLDFSTFLGISSSSRRQDSNLRPPRPERGALPNWATPRFVSATANQSLEADVILPHIHRSVKPCFTVFQHPEVKK